MEARQCCVLMIEDEEDDVFFFERALRKLNFPGELLHAHDPDEACRILEERLADCPPQLVISDSFLHKGLLSGLIDWMRAHPVYHHVPVVVHSGMTGQGMEKLATTVHADLFISKGATPDEMVVNVREALLKLPESCRRWLK